MTNVFPRAEPKVCARLCPRACALQRTCPVLGLVVRHDASLAQVVLVPDEAVGDVTSHELGALDEDAPVGGALKAAALADVVDDHDAVRVLQVPAHTRCASHLWVTNVDRTVQGTQVRLDHRCSTMSHNCTQRNTHTHTHTRALGWWGFLVTWCW